MLLLRIIIAVEVEVCFVQFTYIGIQLRGERFESAVVSLISCSWQLICSVVEKHPILLVSIKPLHPL